MRVRVSAPGKSILMGEHAAVYHRPALVAAVGCRLEVTLETLADDGNESVHLRLPQIGVDERLAWEDVRALTRAVRDAWTTEQRSPGAGRSLVDDDPARLVKVALGETADFLGESRGPALALELVSAIPIGAGFGSSAAIAVAVVDAYLAVRGRTLDRDELHRLTLEVERRQHGRPSGVDNATVIHGGLVWARKGPSGTMTIEPVAATPGAFDGFRLLNTGTPAETTGAVVAAVRRRVEAEPGTYEPVLDRMADTTLAFRREIEAAEPGGGRLRDLVRDFEACLETLGVVPEPIRDLVREIERRGGAAKISGAGALSGHGAGSLLVYHPKVHEWLGWDGWRERAPLDFRFGAEGVRREP